MLVVIPVCEKDLHLAVRNLQWVMSLEGRTDFRALISAERGFDFAQFKELAEQYFIAVDVFLYDKWRGSPNWPQPQNNAWQETARYVEATYKTPWFWWEQDAVPLKAGWLVQLAEAHRAGGRICSGAATTQLSYTYIAGIAIYPPDISTHFCSALLTQAQPWDQVAASRDGIMRKAHDISNLIVHTNDRVNTHFQTREDVTKYIPHDAVLFHKCKDGSLLDVLQGNAPSGEKGPDSIIPTQEYPSFTMQTDWPSGLFTFPCSSNTCYFNCSIAETEGRMFLFTRRYRYAREQITGGALEGSGSDLVIWRMRQNMTLDPHPIIPTPPHRYAHEQFEDPRAIIGKDGRCYVAFATWVHYKQWAIRQSFTRLTQDWRRIEVLWEPDFGGNASKPQLAKGHEKNWTWFQHKDDWHCLYTINPMLVFKVAPNGAVIQKWEHKKLPISWEFGELRGGTPPVKIGDEYLCFFHSAVTWQAPRRRYFMGAFTFDTEPPFNIRRMTMEPLLAGSEEDFRVMGGPLVIFPNGALLQDGEWLVVFGVNDENCGWIKIPHSDLEDRMVNVGRGKNLFKRIAEMTAA